MADAKAAPTRCPTCGRSGYVCGTACGDPYHDASTLTLKEAEKIALDGLHAAEKRRADAVTQDDAPTRKEDGMAGGCDSAGPKKSAEGARLLTPSRQPSDPPTRKEDGKVQAEGQCQHKDLERIGHDEVFCLSCRHLCCISATVATGMQRWYPFPWKDGSNG